MKKEFEWYFSPTDDEINIIWSKGLLTVDTNVLLDLYRYRESTRNSLIMSLKSFGGRLWLTNQAAEEFFRNRATVALSSEKTFKEAIEEVQKLRRCVDSAVNQLKGNRIIPENVANDLSAAICPIIENATRDISEAKENFPEYLQVDPILEDLASMFAGAIGKPFDDNALETETKEAERRRKNKIPPGYLDDDKEGPRVYGDYFMWRQILHHAKNENVPVIFVTSERKEDWWERISGKTIGPRPELLREAHQYCGQRILIYQTDRFLQYQSTRSGQDLDENAVEEIRAIDVLRSESEKAVIENEDLENISRSFEDAEAAIDTAIDLITDALTTSRYSVKPGSRLYLEMRCYLPYVIHKTEIDGTQILVNRHYKPVGSNVLTGGGWAAYEEYPNLHVTLTPEDIFTISSPGHIGGLYHDGNAPWRSRQAAKEYLQRLQLFKKVKRDKGPGSSSFSGK